METYGGCLKKNQEVNFDYITVAFGNMLGCVLAGFIIIPSVIHFGLEQTTGAGLVFSVLPKVFMELGPARLIGFAFFLALLGAGISTSVSIMEITVTAAVDAFKVTRRKAVLIVALITGIGAIPCVWSDGFLNALDWVVNNIGYNFAAAFTAIFVAWKYGANKARVELMNPGSDIQVGKWFIPVYKYVCCAVCVFFCAQAIVALFTGNAF